MEKLKSTLYAKYVKERRDGDILETDHSFVTYKIIGNECQIIDLYVDNKFRKKGLCNNIIDELSEIARSKGCDHLSGNIYFLDPGHKITLLSAIKLGFEIINANNSVITICKRLEG